MSLLLTVRASVASSGIRRPDILIRAASALLVLALLGCSSTSSSPADGGTGGGQAGQHGNDGGVGGAGGVGAALDAGTHPPGNPFTCGDATCVTGQTYCRIRSGPFTGPDGGELPPTYSCQSLCSADDCSCVTVNEGDTYCQSNGCEKTDAGAVTVHCGPI